MSGEYPSPSNGQDPQVNATSGGGQSPQANPSPYGQPAQTSPAPASVQPAQASPSPNGDHSAKQPGRGLRLILEIVVILAIVFGLSFLLRTFVFTGYQIPSGSMETTIMTGDMVFSEKVTYYTRSVQPGDIITFIDPNDSSRTLIKRCIAVAGQTIELKDGSVYVDGVKKDESYTNGKPSYELQSKVVSYPYKVPEGEVWVMGDNRTNSQDSRYFGAVPTSSITGKAFVIYWPLNRISVLN